MIFDTQEHKDLVLGLLDGMEVTTNLKSVMKKDLKVDDKISTLYAAVVNGTIAEPPKEGEPEND